jgi:flagellar motor protein MotB
MSEAEGEGPYVSFTDLLVGLLFILLLMIALLALEVRPKKIPRSPEEMVSEFVTGLGDRLRNSGVDVSVDSREGKLVLGADFLFGRGDADLTPAGSEAVGAIAKELRTILPAHESDMTPVAGTPKPPKPIDIDTILIEGHADSTKIAEGFRYKDNYELSAARARAVLQHIFGIEPELARLKSSNPKKGSLFGIAGYGDGRPSERARSPADAENRRVEIRILVKPASNAK